MSRCGATTSLDEACGLRALGKVLEFLPPFLAHRVRPDKKRRPKDTLVRCFSKICGINTCIHTSFHGCGEDWNVVQHILLHHCGDIKVGGGAPEVDDLIRQ